MTVLTPRLTHTSTPVVSCPAAMETLDNRTLPYTTVTCTHSEVLIDDKENSPITTHFSLINRPPGAQQEANNKLILDALYSASIASRGETTFHYQNAVIALYVLLECLIWLFKLK